MRKEQNTWIALLSAGLISACSAGSDTGSNSARPAGPTPQSPTANELITIAPGDLVGGVTVANLIEACPTGPLPERTGRSLAVDPTSPTVVYVGVEGAGLFRSTDSGLTWQPLVNGLKAHYLAATRSLCFDQFPSLAIDPADPRHLCVGVRGSVGATSDEFAAAAGLYCTTDAGAHWAQQLPGTFSSAVRAVAIAPSGGTIAIGLTEPWVDPQRTGAPPWTDRVAVSRDSGATWTEQDVGPSPICGLTVSSLAFAAGPPDRLYAGIPVSDLSVTRPFEGPQHGLMRSLDGGATWSPLVAGMATRMPSRAVALVVPSPRAPERLLVATTAIRALGGPFTYWSSDGGESFHMTSSPANLDVDLFAFDPSDAQGTHALAIDIDRGEVFESRDGGDTWKSLGVNLPSDTVAGSVRLSHLVWSGDPRVLYASGSHGTVYRTSDGGISWARVLIGAALPVIGDVIP